MLAITVGLAQRTNHVSESAIDKEESPHVEVIKKPIFEKREIITEKHSANDVEKPTNNKFENSKVTLNKQKEEKNSNNDSLGEFVVGNTVKIISGRFKDEEAIIPKIATISGEYACDIDLCGWVIEIYLNNKDVTK